MTPSQRRIFDRVKAFVLTARSISSSELRDAELSIPNAFSIEERTFLTNLAQDLHLALSWDEYDDEDQNLVVLRFSGGLEPPQDGEGGKGDSQDEAEATAAVDCMLRKWDNAKMPAENVEGDYEQKMDECKRAYYSVWRLSRFLDMPSNNPFRKSSGYRTMTPTR
jgi:5'-3' exoribonuclease 1